MGQRKGEAQEAGAHEGGARARRAARALAAVALCGALGGCFGGGPPPHFYTLTPVAPGKAAEASRKGTGPAVQVGDVTVPPSLDRRAMVMSLGGNSLRIADSEEWAAPLGGMVRGVLAQDLMQRLPPGKVLVAGEPAPPSGARTLVVTILQFMSDAGGHVVLQANWVLSPAEGNHGRALRGSETVTSTAGGTGGDAVAAAMSRALGAFADRIAQAIGPG